MTKRKNSHAWCARGPHCTTHEAQQCDIHRWLHCAGHRHWLRNKVDKMISWEKTFSKVKLWLEIWCSFQKIIQNRHRSSQWRLVDICSRRNKHERLHNVFDWKNRIPPFTTVMFFSFASRGSFSLQELVPLNAAQDTRRLGCAMTGKNASQQWMLTCKNSMHTNWLPRTMRPQENQKLLVIFKNSVKAIQANARAMTMKKHVAINLHAHETQEPWIKPYCKQPWCTWNARTNSNDTLKANSLIWSKTFGNHSRPIMKTLQTCMLFVCFLLYNQKNPMQTTLPKMQFALAQKNEQCKLHCP